MKSEYFVRIEESLQRAKEFVAASKASNYASSTTLLTDTWFSGEHRAQGWDAARRKLHSRMKSDQILVLYRGYEKTESDGLKFFAPESIVSHATTKGIHLYLNRFPDAPEPSSRVVEDTPNVPVPGEVYPAAWAIPETPDALLGAEKAEEEPEFEAESENSGAWKRRLATLWGIAGILAVSAIGTEYIMVRYESWQSAQAVQAAEAASSDPQISGQAPKVTIHTTTPTQQVVYHPPVPLPAPTGFRTVYHPSQGFAGEMSWNPVPGANGGYNVVDLSGSDAPLHWIVHSNSIPISGQLPGSPSWVTYQVQAVHISANGQTTYGVLSPIYHVPAPVYPTAKMQAVAAAATPAVLQVAETYSNGERLYGTAFLGYTIYNGQRIGGIFTAGHMMEVPSNMVNAVLMNIQFVSSRFHLTLKTIPASAQSNAFAQKHGYAGPGTYTTGTHWSRNYYTYYGGIPGQYLVYEDNPRDIAFIPLKNVPAYALPLGNWRAGPVGQPVVVLGNRLTVMTETGKPAVTTGITTSRGKLTSTDSYIHGPNGLYFTGSVRPGDSGGPVLNEQGQVVGIASEVIGNYPQNAGCAAGISPHWAKTGVN